MDKSMLKGMVIAASAVTAVGGIAGYTRWERPSYAEVLKIQEATTTVRTPREVCRNVLVRRRAPVRDVSRIAGTAIGAVLGGVLGHQIGGGTGNALATVGGAAAGGYAGNRIEAHLQASDRQTLRKTRCKTVYDTEPKHLGYDVTYRLGDTQGVVRMSYAPGPTIPVKNGHLVLTPPGAS